MLATLLTELGWSPSRLTEVVNGALGPGYVARSVVVPGARRGRRSGPRGARRTGCAAPTERTARSARGSAEVQLERITHQLAALDQAWYWTPQWQAGEAEADADLAADRLVRFHSVAEMDAHLAGIPLPEQAASGSGRHVG